MPESRIILSFPTFKNGRKPSRLKMVLKSILTSVTKHLLHIIFLKHIIFWCPNPKNDFCYCPVISYNWWPSEYIKQVKMSNYWSVRIPIIWHFYLFTIILKATNNKVYSDLGFRLFTRASKNRTKWVKKESKNLWLMSRLYLLVAYPV